MGFGDILIVIIVAVDFFISIWDAYASGYNLGMIKKNKDTSKFNKVAAYSGLGLGFVGATYVLAIVLGVIALYLGYIGTGTLNFLTSIDFIVLGILIIGFGIVITAQSIMIAAKKKSAWSILIALYNSFAVGFDIFIYIESFKESMGVIKRATRSQRGNAYVILLIAVLIAFVIVHAAYRHGYKKAYPEGSKKVMQGMGVELK